MIPFSLDMKAWQICVLLVALAFPGMGGVQAFDSGSVHQEHCTACHARITGGDGHLLYRGTEGLVGDAGQLLARVDHCREGAGLDWTAEQIAVMRDFLNERFYGFEAGE
ncbi:MAG: hypothetical protein OXH88_02375 [Gammaproteobacteria bacterium]|nr:hypothetical protein [Gammaproteobacteria bacterium]